MKEPAGQLEILNTLKQRLHARELQAAQYGISADPAITTEIADLREQIDQLAQTIELESERAHIHAGYLTNPFPAVWLDTYLEYLQSHTLRDFRRDQFVMLSVEPIQSEDPHTLTAIQAAMRSAFDIHVALKGSNTNSEPLQDALADHRLAVLLGSPGIGKTTSLRFIALQHIEAIHTSHAGRLPIWIALNRWIDQDMSASDFLWQEFSSIDSNTVIPRSTFDTWLETGRLLILLDGLNELPQRKLATQHTTPIQDQHQPTDKEDIPDTRENSLFVLAQRCRSRFVISCRLQEYRNIARWHEFIILPLDEEQIDLFAHRHLGKDKAHFDTILTKQPRLRELATIPFYLRSLILLAQSGYASIPNDRFQLIQFMCHAAIQRECVRRTISPTDAETLVHDLSRDAFESMQHGFFGINVHTNPDESYTTMLAYAQGAGLVLNTWHDGPHIIYRYLHQLVQEALALIYLQTEPPHEHDHPQVGALARIGAIHIEWGKLKEAQENAERALELCPLVGAEHLRSTILLTLSQVHRLWHNSRVAIKYTTEAVQLSEALVPTKQLAEIYNELAEVNERLRNYKDAERCYLSAAQIYKQIGEAKTYAYELIYGIASFYALPSVYKIREALAHFDQAIEILHQEEDQLGVIRAKLEKAKCLRRWGDLDQAIPLLHECSADFQALDQPHWRAHALYWLGLALRDGRRFDEALDILKASLDLYKEHNNLSRQFHTFLHGFANVYVNLEKYNVALSCLDQASAVVSNKISPYDAITLRMYGYGYVYWKAKRFDDFFTEYRKSYEMMDDEYRLHLALHERLMFSIARGIGRQPDKKPTAYLLATIWKADALFNKYMNLSTRFGIFLWRLQWWYRRF